MGRRWVTALPVDTRDTVERQQRHVPDHEGSQRPSREPMTALGG